MSKLTTQPAVNLMSILEAYDTDAECRAYIEELRWPKGVECPRCQSKAISRIKARKVFDCDGCRYQFSVTAGTIFHDSHLPLPKWFLAIFLITESRKGMSALQLKRLLKVSYKTAWYLSHRIREAMRDDNPLPLTGTVEVDETYIGGKWRGRKKSEDGRKDWRDRKTAVMGAIQRGGNVRLTAGGRSVTADKAREFIRANVADSCDHIYTDEAQMYRGIGDRNTDHATVDHTSHEYVRGDVHTNTIESAFGLFKRGIVGSFHQVSTKHLDRYLDEFEFRYNNRKNAYLFRDTLIRLTQGEKLPYTKLTKSA
jgi:transposase-like protein